MTRSRTVPVVALTCLIAFLVLACGPSWEPAADDAWEEEAAPPPKVDKSTMKNPWARAKVGDWYIIRVSGARQLKIEVVRASDVEVQVQIGEGEEAQFESYNLQDEEAKYTAPEDLPDISSIVEKSIDVGGKSIPCKVVTRENENGKLVNTYSKQLPLDGIVRSVRDGVVYHDVIDFHKN